MLLIYPNSRVFLLPNFDSINTTENPDDEDGVKRIVRKLLNKLTGNRMISKQECVVLLLQNSLVSCSDSIETVSISNSSRVSISGTMCHKSGILHRYSKRSSTQENMSFHEFFHFTKKQRKLQKPVVPHYTGGQMNVTQPINVGYATSMLNLYKPWRVKYPICPDNIKEYLEFVHHKQIPKYLEIDFVRSLNRHLHSSHLVESVSKNSVYNRGTDKETQDFIDLMGLHDHESAIDPTANKYEFGLNYDWTTTIDEEVSQFDFPSPWKSESCISQQFCLYVY